MPGSTIPTPPRTITPATPKEALRAFHRALDLDPGYYLAYEHTTWILRNASRPEAALDPPRPGIHWPRCTDPRAGKLLDSATVAAGVRLGRVDGITRAPGTGWPASLTIRTPRRR